jgi:hypothetical protein
LFGNSPIRHSRKSGNPDVKDYKPVPLDSCLRRNDGFRTSLIDSVFLANLRFFLDACILAGFR